MKEKKFWFFFSVIMVFRLIVAATAPLADDEAYHWTWTVFLDWSYFDHPGMVAWLEFLTTSFLGPTKLGLRLPAFLSHLGGTLLLYSLAKQMFSVTSAQVVAFLLCFTPLWGLGGFVAAPEPPFVFFWCAGLWVFWQSVRPDEHQWSVSKSWYWLGVIMGLGLNTKFPMALLALGMGLYLLLSQQGRRILFGPWPWLGAGIATVIATPIWIWNIRHGWPSFAYQFYRRHRDEGGVSFHRWGEFIGIQNLFMTPIVYLFFLLTMIWAFKKIREPRFRFIALVSLPTLLIFYIQPFMAAFKPHWPGPGYLVLALGVGFLWEQGWKSDQSSFLQRVVKPRCCWAIIGVLLFIVPLNVVGYWSLYRPLLTQTAALLGRDVSNPEWDYSHDFYGWELLAEKIKERQREIAQDSGARPLLASFRYELVGRLWFFTQERAYNLSHDMNQFQIWQPPEAMEALKGKNFLFVGTGKYYEEPMRLNVFANCEKEELKIYRNGFYARSFYIWACQNFQGVR